MLKRIIIANWKMNPAAPGRAALLANKVEQSIARIRNVDVVLTPPFPFIMPVAAVIKKAKLGAQDVFWKDTGAYTGEVSWQQLKHLNVGYVIVGHSERRIFLHETDEMVREKVHALLTNGMTPIVCVGERERMGDDIPQIIDDQIKAALKDIKNGLIKKLVIAYEPIWAISTMPGAQADTPHNAFRVMMYIRKTISDLYGRAVADEVRIIYGGSVNANNVAGFLRDGHMQGALVGSASLDAAEFAEIVKIAAGNKK